MDHRTLHLRRLTPAEYETATERREVETARELAAFLPAELARERAREGTAHFLLDGRETSGHHLVVAEDAAGRAVGDAWARTRSTTAKRLRPARPLDEQGQPILDRVLVQRCRTHDAVPVGHLPDRRLLSQRWRSFTLFGSAPSFRVEEG
ncbi:hypothetical protein ACFV1L_11670 [Kitasatospora sp. NPDC059646]|uniref:hypothetical protein n=1 Tax=Kitasatospora sp. NPDC059646 TaxID=3346893 RepID=UPI0036CB2B7F